MVFYGLSEASAQCSQWNTTISAKCENTPQFQLTGGTPSPGIYVGTGVVGTGPYFFNPAAAGAGNHTIGYKANSCTDTAFKVIVVNTVTAASLSGLDTAYCSNRVPQTVAVTTSPSGGTLAGPGISGSTFNIGNAGVGNHTIKYYYINSNNCTDTAYSQVHVRALPTVTLNIPNPQKFVCEFDGAFGITGQSPSSVGWPTAWFTGNDVDTVLGTFAPASTNVGWNVITYHYYDGLCSNKAVDSILVNQNPAVTLSTFPSPCANDDPIPLNYGSPTGTQATYSGTGVTGGGGVYYFDPSVAGAGTHVITYCYTAPNGCETCVSQNIIVHPVPTVVFNSAPPLCENAGGVNLNSPIYVAPTGGYFSGPGVDPSDSVTWRTGQLGPGSFNITYTYADTNGCSKSVTQSISINPTPNVKLNVVPMANQPVTDSFNLEVSICLGDSVTMTYSSSPTVPTITPFPALKFGQISSNYYFYPEETFFYNLIAAATNGCIDTGGLNVVVIQPTDADILGDKEICIGDTTTLEGVDYNDATGVTTTFEWVNQMVTAPSITINPVVTTDIDMIAYSGKDGDGNQCSSDTTASVVVVDPLPLINTARDTVIFMGDSLILRAYGGESYVWYSSDTNELSCMDCNQPVATPIFDRTNLGGRVYFVVGTDSNGCVNTDSIIVDLNQRIVIFVPTAFSPNGDGVNDELVFKTKGIKGAQIEVYDRYGRTVFETLDVNDTWDGTFEGELLGKDVYLWKMIARPYKSGIPIEQAGQTTLVR